ncbi:MAG: universal stress protein [Gemmatimonadales bacterium]|jgi:nucleotide-binding universal stress UspA family protein
MTDFNKVLAATDGSEHGLNAVVTGAAWAARAGASFEVATIVEVLLLPPEYAPPGVEPAEYELAFVRDAREKAENQAAEAGAAGASIRVRAGLAPQLVNRIAAETEADLVVIGASPQPARGSLVGATGRRTLYLAQRPVLLASEARREPFRRVLAAVDLSEMSGAVLQAAWTLAKADRAELRVLYVLEPLPLVLAKAASIDEAERLRHGREQMEKVLEKAGLLGEDSVQARMREGRSGHEILEEAQGWDADLVAVGTHGFGFFDRLLLGSTPLYVLRHGQRPTLVVPRRESGD